MLWYCPLEPLRERYTMQLSAPVTGWFEREWRNAGIQYRRVDGQVEQKYTDPGTIKIGQVLDAPNRCCHAFSQITELLQHAQTGRLKNNDVIYFDDFWHPGVEALGYCFSQMGLSPKMYAYCWAQSVDQYDFTYSMRDWMSHFEKGNMALLEGVFVANSLLKELLVEERQFDHNKVHVVGLPFCSQEVMERMPGWYQDKMKDGHGRLSDVPRQNKVIFSSRWDNEKNPQFFLKVAYGVLEKRRDVAFVVCTSAPKLRSNSVGNIRDLDEARSLYPENIILREGLTKEAYYEELCTAKVQINTADQDWVSFTLLEASTAGCMPMYPATRSFPETFVSPPGVAETDLLYRHLDVDSAVAHLLYVLSFPESLWDSDNIKQRSWIHRRYDSTWARQAKIMGVWNGVPEVENPYTEDACRVFWTASREHWSIRT